MGSTNDNYVDRETFEADTFSNPALFTTQSSGYASDNMLAFSQSPAFQPVNSADIMSGLSVQQLRPDVNPLQLCIQMNSGMWSNKASQMNFPDGLNSPHSNSGLDMPPTYANLAAFQNQTMVEPDSLQPVFSAQSVKDNHDIYDQADTAGAKPSSPKKRSVDTYAELPPKKGRKGRKSSKAKAEPEAHNEGEDAKCEKFLERNRLAATKCRQKKKEWTNQLEERARELLKERQFLTATVGMLKDELLELKCKCLEHSECQCDQIREYLTKRVATMAPSTSVYSDPSIFDRRQSAASTSSFDEGGESVKMSHQPSFGVESPRVAPAVDEKFKSILNNSLASASGSRPMPN